MKRLLTLALAIAMTFTFAGCAATENDDLNTDKTLAPDVTEAPEDSEEVTTTTEATTEEVTTQATTTEEITTQDTTTGVTTATEATTTITTTEATTITTTEATVKVEDMSAVMYAKSSVNVRTKPDASSERVGHLDEGDEVTVTGKAENGWYRIELKKGEYFVSGKYLTDVKSEPATTESTEKEEETTSGVKPGKYVVTGSFECQFSDNDYDSATKAGTVTGSVENCWGSQFPDITPLIEKVAPLYAVSAITVELTASDTNPCWNGVSPKCELHFNSRGAGLCQDVQGFVGSKCTLNAALDENVAAVILNPYAFNSTVGTIKFDVKITVLVVDADAPSDANHVSASEADRTDPDELYKYAVENVTSTYSSNEYLKYSHIDYGEIVTITYYSDTCKRERRAKVLLPAGYSEDKTYPVVYALHGYWGDENSLPGDDSLKMQQIIGNAIHNGEAVEMIVVFPYIYASATRETLSGMNAESNAAYDNFINDLVNDLMPYMEKNFSIRTGRKNTAVTGFSMGGRESLYIGFERTDLFGYIGAMCPAPGLDVDLLSPSEFKFDKGKEPYLLYITAGSNDGVVGETPAAYHRYLDNNKVQHVWQYIQGAGHDASSIRPHMYNFVRFVFK
ncbi:MAG: SH3 domain-containing protein [Oscillospiraceae bacterium]|nr:SH3 domain-containing protein [Oscillospiraceae bacterium]